MTKHNGLKQLLLIFTGAIFLFIIYSFTHVQIVRADDNKDYENALASAPKGLNWDNNAFVIANFQAAAEKRLRRPVIVPSNNIFNSSMTNNAQITQSTNPDPNTKGTSVIKMTNGTYQTGAVWSSRKNDNYFDIRHPQKASMWLYFGPSTGDTGFVGDGMAFVLQNDNNAENSIALSADGIPVNGQALGVWGADWDHGDNSSPEKTAQTAIQNSWALEFDTFVNRYKPSTSEGVSFDFNIGGIGNAENNYRHIAGNYPALASTYDNDKSNFPRYTTMNHGNNYKIHPHLVDDQWHHVTITWTPKSDTDHSQGTITYAYNDKDTQSGIPITDPKQVVQTSFNIDTKNFGLTGDNTKLYWGFTGSTGKYSENNLLVFESIPSFVDAEAVPAIYDDSQGGTEITESNNTVDPNSDIRYTYTLNYKGWTKNWDKINTKVDIPDHVKFTSGTITYPNSADNKPHQIDPSIFNDSNATKLKFLLPDKLTPKSRTAIIELHGKTEKNATESLTVPSSHASFEGDNLITDANTIPFKIRYRKLSLDSDSPNIIKVKPNEDVFIPAQVTYAGSNNNPYYQNLTVYQKLNNGPVETQDLSFDSDGNFELPIYSYSLDKINTVSFYVKDQDGNTSNTITRQITVGGNLAFDYVQNIVSFKPINGSFTDGILPRLGKWQINVVDSREKGSQWSVQAKASDLVSEDKNKLLGNLFYRDTDGKDYDIDKDFPVATYVKDTDDTQIKNIADTWTDNSGILLAVKKGNKAGIYTSKISWSLIDSTPNK
ncbi:lectin-like domain-containing protein [Companilactobacillus bobalius]|uniref:Cell surface protein n=3 Tax=Companilactobacillus bobalius TaxID=2801451 RepID=A0A202FAB4_9LACO|nr:hypothetical protein [Companilactobacillus bobalius]KAE9557690.1 hypothetical protein ATN92_16200 [Companilactobacillus bobalius]KRK83907.1 hypothetical protein FC78_GL000910 [Companilactobacillus bobalius DSM 19674]OVE97406.1 hypothetical protein LKACC16343_01896 [Companilactobacillus bobalius]GEO59534.1 cell surface protein [Companilactobacillus paralimentarius]